ncbi:S49 family peptidase [Oleiphilus messinensis]|uniref:S49 family peptidase n=2 Tax=Oleiphilus messinensis TaxID=141451 RepID=A0A1Y0IA81_9GAMM|nr:S49 family peptidase [Oleiphilus messinensis]
MGIASATMRGKKHQSGHIEVTHLNKKLEAMKESIEEYLLDKEILKKRHKEQKKADKEKRKQSKQGIQPVEDKKRVFVLNFDGDIRASANDHFREEISAVLAIANKDRDEVVVRLESGGGMVHSYGLASAQLDRIKKKSVPLTVCVDKVAASGGYMMACVADKIVASPFAVVGSIGVVAQLPNFHKLLKKNEIDFEVLTAGEYKRTLTVFGENTDKGREKFQDDLEDTHELFKSFVNEHRPKVELDKVANGDVWFGQRAMDVNLVDELMTSDELIETACDHSEVFEVKYIARKSLQEKLGIAASIALENTFMKVWSMVSRRPFQ